MEETGEETQNREVANATQDVPSERGLDEQIDLGNQNHSYPKRIDRGAPRIASNMTKNGSNNPSPSVKGSQKRKIPAGYHARSNSTDMTGSNMYKTQGEGTSPNHFNSSGFISNEGSNSNYGGPEAKRRIWDGTSQKELLKAMSTYLNKTGAGDYSLPQMTGQKIVEATRRNQPNWSMQSRTKLAWFPGRTVDFQGGYSPPSTKYSPGADRDFRNQIFSVGKFERFHKPSSLSKVQKQVPHMYTTMSDGLETFKPDNYNFQKVGMGYGTKSDFTNSKQQKQIPGPIYDCHEKNSISYQSVKQHPKTLYGFYNKFDKQEKTCYKGQEQHFYGREGKGPGAYLPTEFVHLSLTKKASQFSVPKNDRGLLTKKFRNVPGPGNYENEAQGIKVRNQVQTFAMPRASRDVSFSKYGAQHSSLIKKGLF